MSFIPYLPRLYHSFLCHPKRNGLPCRSAAILPHCQASVLLTQQHSLRHSVFCAIAQSSGVTSMGFGVKEGQLQQSGKHGLLRKLSGVASAFSQRKRAPALVAVPDANPDAADASSFHTPPLPNLHVAHAGAAPLAEPAVDQGEAAQVAAETSVAAGGKESTSTVEPSRATCEGPTNLTPTQVVPGIKVIPFQIREPSIGLSIVGQIMVLEGSCFVWTAVEGSTAQGSLAAAVTTRFEGGMPTATHLLQGAGEEQGSDTGASMAQRLCRKTGRMCFVSCDLSDDAQVCVAAVEAKVIALLKAEGGQ